MYPLVSTLKLYRILITSQGCTLQCHSYVKFMLSCLQRRLNFYKLVISQILFIGKISFLTAAELWYNRKKVIWTQESPASSFIVSNYVEYTKYMTYNLHVDWLSQQSGVFIVSESFLFGLRHNTNPSMISKYIGRPLLCSRKDIKFHLV